MADRGHSPGGQLRRRIVRVLESGRALYRGSLIRYSRTCGHPRCRCGRGQPHTGWALSFSQGGKTRVVYLPDDLRGKAARGLRDYKGLLARLEEVVAADVAELQAQARRYKKRG